MTPRDARELAQMCRESRGCNSAILEHLADTIVSQADEIDALKAAAIVQGTIKLAEWAKWEQECERLRAEVLSVRESLQRERAGQVRCNAGHVSDRALWDCPVCVEAMRARLALAERLCRAVSRCEQNQGRFSCTALHDSRCLKGRTISRLSESTADAECTCGGDEYQLALAAWEEADG